MIRKKMLTDSIKNQIQRIVLGINQVKQYVSQYIPQQSSTLMNVSMLQYYYFLKKYLRITVTNLLVEP